MTQEGLARWDLVLPTLPADVRRMIASVVQATVAANAATRTASSRSLRRKFRNGLTPRVLYGTRQIFSDTPRTIVVVVGSTDASVSFRNKAGAEEQEYR
jgi:hypothetical protein